MKYPDVSVPGLVFSLSVLSALVQLSAPDPHERCLSVNTVPELIQSVSGRLVQGAVRVKTKINVQRQAGNIPWESTGSTYAL